MAIVGGGVSLPGLLLVVCEAMLFLPGLLGKLFAVLGRGDVFFFAGLLLAVVGFRDECVLVG